MRTHASPQSSRGFVNLVLTLLVCTLFLAGCSSSAPPEKSSGRTTYKADKDLCGNIVFSRKLGEDYDSALAILSTEKKNLFSKYCPDNPCAEVEIAPHKVQELTDLDGNKVDLDIYLISVKDASTKVLLHSLSEAIDEEGNLYDVAFCPD